MEERYAAAQEKRRKADVELAASKAVAAEKGLPSNDPALTALRALRAKEAEFAAAQETRRKADVELAASKAVAAEKGLPSNDPALTSTEAHAAAKKKRADADAKAKEALENAAKAKAAAEAAKEAVRVAKAKAAVAPAKAAAAADEEEDDDDVEVTDAQLAARMPRLRAAAAAGPLTEAEIFERDRKLTKETALRPLPEGWKRRGPDEENDIWYESPDGTTQFSNPNYTPKLPDGWIERQDAEGDVWFINPNTKASQYLRPMEGGKRRRARGGGGEKPPIASHVQINKPLPPGGGRRKTRRALRAPRRSTRGRRR